ncbi:MAG: PspC domain-containing protein [Acidimicrobiales bacterium]
MVFVILAFVSGLGLALYVVGWIIMPVGNPWPPAPNPPAADGPTPPTGP